MAYTCYDKIYTVLGIGAPHQAYQAPRAPADLVQALPEQAQKACLLGALIERKLLEVVFTDTSMHAAMSATDRLEGASAVLIRGLVKMARPA